MIPGDRRCEVILDHLYTSSQWPDLMAATTEIATTAQRHQLALGAFGAPAFMYPEPTEGTYAILTKAVALNLHWSWLLTPLELRSNQSGDRSVEPGPCFRQKLSCIELRLVVERGSTGPHYSLRDMYLDVVQWTNLLRLSIDWHYSVP